MTIVIHIRVHIWGSLWLLVIHSGFILGFISDDCYHIGVHLRGSFVMIVITWGSYWGSSLGFICDDCYSFGVHLYSLWGSFVMVVITRGSSLGFICGGWLYISGVYSGYLVTLLGFVLKTFFFGVRWLAFVIVRSRE